MNHSQENNTKYYVPEISDLFIGYECEWKRVQDINWIPCTLNAGMIEDWDYARGDIGNEMNPEIRTPYLTREQVEAEGWKPSELKEECRKYTKTIGNTTWILTLFDNHDIRIVETYPLSGSDIRYDGKCPSINEFRKTIKLLGM